MQDAFGATGPVANMNLDVRIQTAPDVALQTSVAKSIEGDASLTLRGTATNPALLGRINITQGEMVFFGNKYSINQGSISFFNPARIDPILNIDLETKTRGVDVILTVAGPMTKLNVSYRSDPPLQFADIVALLATGRAPGDPTLSGAEYGRAGFPAIWALRRCSGQALANPGERKAGAFLRRQPAEDRPAADGRYGQPGSAALDRAAGDAGGSVYLYHRCIEHEHAVVPGGMVVQPALVGDSGAGRKWLCGAGFCL